MFGGCAANDEWRMTNDESSRRASFMAGEDSMGTELSKLSRTVTFDHAAPLMERLAHGFEAFRLSSGEIGGLGGIVVEVE